MVQVCSMMATICGRFRLELDPQMGGEAGVLERQISSFTLAVDGGLFLQFHDRTQVGQSHDSRTVLRSRQAKTLSQTCLP